MEIKAPAINLGTGFLRQYAFSKIFFRNWNLHYLVERL